MFNISEVMLRDEEVVTQVSVSDGDPELSIYVSRVTDVNSLHDICKPL